MVIYFCSRTGLGHHAACLFFFQLYLSNRRYYDSCLHSFTDSSSTPVSQPGAHRRLSCLFAPALTTVSVPVLAPTASSPSSGFSPRIQGIFQMEVTQGWRDASWVSICCSSRGPGPWCLQQDLVGGFAVWQEVEWSEQRQREKSSELVGLETCETSS